MEWMTLELLLKGFLVGLCIAAPVGPVGLLCIKTTLQYGRMAGLATGAGAAVADTLWAAVGAFSLVFIMSFLEAHSLEIRLFGGIILLALGAFIIFKHPSANDPEAMKKMNANMLKDFVTTFFITLSNPATIFAFLAVFAGFGLHTGGDMQKAVPLLSGVMIGSLFWWYALSFWVSLFRIKISEQSIHKINLLSGFFIAIFGLGALLSAVKFF
ncbi:MAG TPA: LysE family transporter [Alphaproteobacteria bacterium]|nr:LysE family transporter [Micavibrio sp.]MBK9561634.1 LysE family transporter [Micavibrio sp.]HQX26917.1 LysE family transporter [Alphaproteobacteria bacterium]